MENFLETQSVKDFCKKMNFVQAAPKVRKNMNGYPYVTFIDSDNKAENIYFSKRAAELIEEDTKVNVAFLSQYQIAFLKNEEGEDRIKLISNSERVTLEW